MTNAHRERDLVRLYHDGWSSTWNKTGPTPENPIVVRADKLRPERLAHLESLRWRLQRQLTRLWDEIEELAKDLHRRGEVAHARVGDDWRLYRTESRPTPTDPDWVSWYFDWLHAPPAEPQNVAVGERLWQLESFCWHSNGQRRVIVETALEYCIRAILSERRVELDRLARIHVNGRDYLYRYTQDKYEGRIWKRVSWPEDETIVVEAQ